MSDSCGCPLDAAVLKAPLRLNGVMGGDTDEAAARPGCIGGEKRADEAGSGVLSVCMVPVKTDRGSSGLGIAGGGTGGGGGTVQSLRSDSSHLHGVSWFIPLAANSLHGFLLHSSHNPGQGLSNRCLK